MCKVISVTVKDRTFNVADIKQKYMENIIDAAEKCDFIERVVLFGSSIEKRCKKTSDIDIAVFGKHSRSRALKSKKYEKFARQLYSFDDHNQAYDILYFQEGRNNTDLIFEGINKGEILYER